MCSVSVVTRYARNVKHVFAIVNDKAGEYQRVGSVSSIVDHVGEHSEMYEDHEHSQRYDDPLDNVTVI